MLKFIKYPSCVRFTLNVLARKLSQNINISKKLKLPSICYIGITSEPALCHLISTKFILKSSLVVTGVSEAAESIVGSHVIFF